MRAVPALLLLAVALTTTSHAARHMKLVHGWHEVDYTYPDAQTKQTMIDDGRLVVGASVPIAFDVDTARDRIFISMPRFKVGNAAALATVTNVKSSRGDLKLKPYPDWRWHRQGDCEGITSVFRALVDECNRLWVVDTGTVGGSVDVAVGVNRICPAQLLVFNLENDKLLKRHVWPEGMIKAHSVLTTVAVEVRDTADKCRKTFAYVADVSGFGILVYDMAKEDSWRVESNTMFPFPPQGVYRIAGREFDLMDGVLALALTPKPQGSTAPADRTLFYHSLSGDRESWVSTHLLRNKTNFLNNNNLVPRQFYSSEAAREQAASEAFDQNGVLFFSILPSLSLNCWNSKLPYTAENLVEVDQDSEQFQFASGIKVKRNKQGVEEVWMLSSRFQMHMTGDVDPADVNYRLMKAPVEELVRGTSCQVGKKPTTLPGGNGGSYGGGGNRPTNVVRPVAPGNRPVAGGGGANRPRPTGSYGGGAAAVNPEGSLTFPTESDDETAPPVNAGTKPQTYSG